MLSSTNIHSKLGKGITPESFIEKMRPKYKETLDRYYNLFTWEAHNREAIAPLKQKEDIQCSILAGDWCGDVHRNLGPILEVMKEAEIPTEIFIMEEHDDLMEQFLTMGGRSVPKVILTNKEGDVLFSWGPRPAYIQEPMIAFKQLNLDADNPVLDEERQKAYEGIFARYGKNGDYQKLVVYELTNQLLQL